MSKNFMNTQMTRWNVPEVSWWDVKIVSWLLHFRRPRAAILWKSWYGGYDFSRLGTGYHVTKDKGQRCHWGHSNFRKTTRIKLLDSQLRTPLVLVAIFWWIFFAVGVVSFHWPPPPPKKGSFPGQSGDLKISTFGYITDIWKLPHPSPKNHWNVENGIFPTRGCSTTKTWDSFLPTEACSYPWEESLSGFLPSSDFDCYRKMRYLEAGGRWTYGNLVGWKNPVGWWMDGEGAISGHRIV